MHVHAFVYSNHTLHIPFIDERGIKWQHYIISMHVGSIFNYLFRLVDFCDVCNGFVVYKELNLSIMAKKYM